MTDHPTPTIRAGIGGWTYAPWRRTFSPPDLPHARELEYASRRLGTIEINATYYSLQSAKSYARWRDATPDGFVFALKGSRYVTNRRVLADAGPAVERFVASGLAELGPKLGPIVWQLAPTKRFDAADVAAFIALLPASVGGVALRHALEVRHASFACADYVALARRCGIATVFTDSADYPGFADVTGSFVYARLMRMDPALEQGFAAAQLDALAACARAWRDGAQPAGLPRVEPAPQAPAAPRDVFVLFIDGAKERAPAAAMALQQRIG